MANDALFFQELATGHQHTLVVGSALLTAGFTVHVPPSVRRDHVDDRARWASEVDAWVGRACTHGLDGHLRGPLPLEVKSRNLRFTSPADFGYTSAFVDTKTGWERKSPAPSAVILVSQHTRAMVVVRRRTRASWSQETKVDRVRGITETWLTCPRSALQPFPEFLVDLGAYLPTCCR